MGPNGTPSLVPFQGPKKSRFSGPTPSNAPRNDVALLKTITYRAIKTTGTLIVIIDLDWLYPSPIPVDEGGISLVQMKITYLLVPRRLFIPALQ